jgi:hypothetical protein
MKGHLHAPPPQLKFSLGMTSLVAHAQNQPLHESILGGRAGTKQDSCLPVLFGSGY